MKEEMRRPPAMLLYAKDWEPGLEVLTDEELGGVLKALFRYLDTGEEMEFSDRAVRVFYGKMLSLLDRQIQRYGNEMPA